MLAGAPEALLDPYVATSPQPADALGSDARDIDGALAALHRQVGPIPDERPCPRPLDGLLS